MPNPITRETLLAAKPFTLISGEAESNGFAHWAVFELSGCTRGDTDHASELTGVDVFDMSPMRDDEACYELRKPDGSQYDDFDAALAYLNKGGTLMKVPDEEGSPHWRLLVAVSIIC